MAFCAPPNTCKHSFDPSALWRTKAQGKKLPTKFLITIYGRYKCGWAMNICLCYIVALDFKALKLTCYIRYFHYVILQIQNNPILGWIIEFSLFLPPPPPLSLSLAALFTSLYLLSFKFIEWYAVKFVSSANVQRN